MTKDQLIEIVVKDFPEAESVVKRQSLVNVEFVDYGGDTKFGQIVVDRDLEKDVKEFFQFCLTINYPFAKMIPIQQQPYFSDDEASMLDNNSSGFNFRYIANTKRLSPHAFGFAIDLNPFDNPVQIHGKTITPKGAVRDESNFKVFTSDHPVVKWLKERGWDWLGEREKPNQDYHHFQKVLAIPAYLTELSRQLEYQEIDRELYQQLLTSAQRNYEKI